jgi:hypothetical protein
MTTPLCLDNMPCNHAVILPNSTKKLYGNRDPLDNGQSVKIFYLGNEEKILKMNRSARLETTRTGHYINSNRMVPCREELKTGFCEKRFDPNHKKFFHHYGYHEPTFNFNNNTCKPICRYSTVDPGNICWERYNSEHIKAFHHE